MEILKQVIANQTFLQNIFLLLLTATLTGLLVPYIKAQVDYKKLVQQKRFEADLARQAKVIESQVKLLEDLAQLLWQYEFLALKVSYYKGDDEEGYRQAVKDFDQLSWESLIKIRTEVSKSRRLTSNVTYRRLHGLYEWLIESDEELSFLIENDKATQEEWNKRHATFFDEGARRIDDALKLLADDLRLAGDGDAPPGAVSRAQRRPGRL